MSDFLSAFRVFLAPGLTLTYHRLKSAKTPEREPCRRAGCAPRAHRQLHSQGSARGAPQQPQFAAATDLARIVEESVRKPIGSSSLIQDPTSYTPRVWRYLRAHRARPAPPGCAGAPYAAQQHQRTGIMRTNPISVIRGPDWMFCGEAFKEIQLLRIVFKADKHQTQSNSPHSGTNHASGSATCTWYRSLSPQSK